MTDKIIMLTAYDYPTAKILDNAGIDIILVGDSLGNVVLGHENTKSVTMQDMVHHTKAVSRAVNNSMLVADMPINSYNNKTDAIENANLLINAGAHAVKIEGRPEIVKALNNNKIKVMGHVGLLPQTAENYKVQGKEKGDADKIMKQASDLSNAGAFSIVIECVPEQLAKNITETVECPTIGIGAGPHCKGQVLVLHDLIGLSEKTPSFVKPYNNIKQSISKAVDEFKNDVKEGRFP
jgi:3-methyl-2-oxobutanoate hydroxymethyltransferase